MTAAISEATAEPVVVDLRPMIPPERHAMVFAALDALRTGAHLRADQRPCSAPAAQPDRTELARCVRRHFLRDGPEVWQVAITRLSE